MCEYCGCQSLAAIAELTAEHDQVVDLIGEIRAAHRLGDVETMLELCRRIMAVLATHTMVEEQGLFPVMALDFPEQIAILQGEHRRIETILAEANDALAPDPTWPSRAIDALVLLREHIFKEQDGVFPAALSTLSSAQWDRLEELRNAQSLPAPSPTLATRAEVAKAPAS